MVEVEGALDSEQKTSFFKAPWSGENSKHKIFINDLITQIADQKKKNLKRREKM